MKIILIFTLMLTGILCADSQAQNYRNTTVSAYMGHQQLLSNMYGNRFDISVARQLYPTLYVQASYTTGSATQSLSSMLTGYVSVGPDQRIGQHVSLGSGISIDPTSMPGQLAESNSFAIGLQKYVRLGERLLMSGSLQLARSSITHQYIQVDTDEEGNLRHDDFIPQYSKYHSIGGVVRLQADYHLKDHVSICVGIHYISSPNTIALQIGASTWIK